MRHTVNVIFHPTVLEQFIQDMIKLHIPLPILDVFEANLTDLLKIP
jgi:hypothetical protein